jgi:hypothetical protein
MAGAAVDPKQMVSSTQFYDFFANLVARDPGGLSLPLRIGATMRSDEYGAFGLAWKTAPSLRGSYARSQRYGHVLGSAETYTLEQSNDGWFFSLDKAGDGRLGMLLSNEASMAAVDVISREVTTASFAPLAVYFKHAARGDVSVYETHFGCPVHFESGRDALLISEDTLDAPNRLGDETVVSFFDRHLEEELASVATMMASSNGFDAPWLACSARGYRRCPRSHRNWGSGVGRCKDACPTAATPSKASWTWRAGILPGGCCGKRTTAWPRSLS